MTTLVQQRGTSLVRDLLIALGVAVIIFVMVGVWGNDWLAATLGGIGLFVAQVVMIAVRHRRR